MQLVKCVRPSQSQLRRTNLVLSLDTNILFCAMIQNCKDHSRALSFLQTHLNNPDLVITELILVELYVLLRNDSLTGIKTTPAQATGWIQQLRNNPFWTLIENAPVMEDLWKMTSKPLFARRRIFDLRAGLTLRHHGVTQFATANVKDFQGLGFEKVWNPLIEN